MIVNALIPFHVVLSLIGIGTGFVVVRGLLFSDPPYRGKTRFVATTAATSVTGFFFPFHGFTPGLAVGILSLIVLLIACLAAYRYSLTRGWRRTFAITTVIALYFNVFILVIQSFRKVPALHAIAPTQSEPPFQAAQSLVLVIFVAIGIRAVIKTKLIAGSPQEKETYV
jgi:hypothetical protein